MNARFVLRRCVSVGAVAAVIALGGADFVGAGPTAQAAEAKQRIVYPESTTVDGLLTRSLVSMNADGTDRRTLVPTGDGLPKATYESPVYSPDGRHLAFISEDGYGDIWVANPDGSGARPVVMDVQDPDGWVTQLTWGPNSDMLYLGFQSMPGHDRLRLMKVNLDGSGLDYVLPDQPNVFDGQPSVAPDGTLAFLHGSSIMVYDPRTGGTPTLLTWGLQPAYSPDGTKLAFVRQASGGGGPQVFVRDLAGGQEKQITEDGGGVIYPSWSPDGTKLAYLAGGTDMRLTVHSATAAGGPGTALTDGDVQGEGRPAWVIPARTPGPGPDLTGDGRPDLVVRDRSGVLWLYRGTGSASTPFAARTSIGAGWNTYNSLVSAGDVSGDGRADLLGRDGSGVLWLYKGTGKAAVPYAARTKVGAGWSAYNSLTEAGDVSGDGRADLLGRDGSGVLWLYKGTGKAAVPYAARTKVGAGWSAYNSLTEAGDVSGDGRADLLGRDSSGVLWLYKGTGKAAVPYAARTKVGAGWSAYNSLVSAGDLTGDGRADLLGRDGSGVLWLYKGTGKAAVPYAARTKVGAGWNAYNALS
ncbi:FG-GAP-like repeat-containing protein [Streptomyces sp. NBC_00184]|uniref:FG-GAP-like repeat-containing protein n=1 Tax=Streptomyces sp. NBC_00184 TaxID=2975673 RepID=UPI002E2A6863|nr:FG-GAP-like repeat-containing protein [Streptomyces sp. NBC_00184]